MGVTCDSALGPFRFFIYINDLPRRVANVEHNIVLLDGDTSLLFKVKNHQYIITNCDVRIKRRYLIVDNWIYTN